jgi:hypothetical protein
MSLCLLTGQETAPATTAVRAGPLELELGDAEIRYVRSGDVEILRRIYAAVRDPVWNTAPVQLGQQEVEIHGQSFRARFPVRYVLGALEVDAVIAIEGEEDGTLRFAFDGVTRAAFDYGRIGLCILHGPGTWSGRPFVAEGAAGRHEGTFPELIAPNVQDGVDTPLFPAFRSLRASLAGGLDVSLELDGDDFEIEDQRNWTDASFKTYSTPLALGWPRPAAAGEWFRQTVVIRVRGAAKAARARAAAPVLETERGGPWSLPALGVGAGGKADERQLALLRSLALDHVRVDTWASDENVADALGRDLDTAEAAGTAVELAVHLPAAAEGDLEAVGRAAAKAPAVARVLVFREGELCTTGATIAEARRRLAPFLPHTPIYGGTDAWFAQLNAERAGVEEADGLAYSITPQVHAFDEASVVENLAAQAETIRTARSFAAGKPVAVSPVTLRMRFNPDAGPGAERLFETAVRADPRQPSLFCAAWTLGSIRHLAEAGAASATFYEAAGPCGVVDEAVFPVYHVLADLAGRRRAAVVPVRSSEPLRAEAVLLEDGPSRMALVASLVPAEQEVVLAGFGALRRSRRLSQDTVGDALGNPEQFRAAWTDESSGGERLRLGPYEVVTLELA